MAFEQFGCCLLQPAKHLMAVGNVQGSEKIPKVVQEIRDMLKNSGQTLSMESLKKLDIDSKTTNNLTTVFRNSLNEKNKKSWNELQRTDPARKDLILQFILDPGMAKMEGFNRATVIKTDKKTEEEWWRTPEQLAGPTFYNSKEHVQILLKAKALPERPHEIPALAETGVMQYLYVDFKACRAHGTKEEAGTESRASLTADDYKTVTESIQKIATEGPKIKINKRKAEKPEDSPETKRLKAAKASRNSTITKTKAALDKAVKEARELETELPKLTQKQYPEHMVEWFRGKIDGYKAQIEELRTKYVEQASKVFLVEPSAEELQEDTTKIEEALKEHDKNAKNFKDGVKSDVTKLVG